MLSLLGCLNYFGSMWKKESKQEAKQNIAYLMKCLIVLPRSIKSKDLVLMMVDYCPLLMLLVFL